MATYGTKYIAEWMNTRGHVYRLLIKRRGYTGSSKSIGALAGCALEVQGAQGRIIDPIIKTQLRFSVVDAWDKAETTTEKFGDWQEFFTPDATLYKVELYEMNGSTATIIWSGYITPDSWQEDLDYRGIITITARDNIGHLKDFPFVANGSITPDANGLIEIRWLLERAMEIIEFPMDLSYEQAGQSQYSPEVPCAEDGDYLIESCVVASLFEGMDWYQVLEQTLESIGYAFRYVGGNKCVIGSLRNLPKVGHYTDATSSQIVEFYGGTQELDPAVKKIEEELDYKFTEEVPLEALGSFQFSAGSAYRCIVEGNGDVEPIAAHSAPLDILTNTDGSVWDTGSEMFNPDSRTPDDYLINSEGADGWKQYAMIPGNRDTDDPSTSFRFHTKTAAIRIVVNFAPFPVGIIGTGNDAGKVTSLQYSLFKIRYQVSFVSEDGNTIRYWNGGGWSSDHEHTMIREYDSENEYGTVLEVSLSECKEISTGKIVVRFSNIIYKRWDDAGVGVYARVQSILTGVISTRGAKSNKVTTINNDAYNVAITRRPLFGVLSREMGFVRPTNYTAGLFYYPFVGANPALFPYLARFTDQSATVPLPVLIHQQILCYYFGAARILSGSCGVEERGRFSFGKLCSYKGVSYIFQGGVLDLFSGIVQGAVLREYAVFEELWTGAPTYDDTTHYNTDAPGTGHSGGNSGGGGGGGGGTVTSVGLTMPTGFSVQGSPVTGLGTLAVSYAEGYSIPTTAKQGQWDNKQDAINDLNQIRIGAGKGDTAYQKPQNGIPSTDLASGVIPDVSQFITRLVNDLVNYYTKSETYTKAEVAALIGAIQTFHYEIAASTSAVTSPSNNVLYLIGPTGSGADKYEEYVYDPTKAVNERWVKIGDTSIDLSGLLPKTGGTLTGDLRLKPTNANYGLRIRFGDGDYVYLLEDTDDHLVIYADRGLDLSTGSGYDVTVNGIALTPTDYVTKSGEQTITGEKTFTTKPVHIGSTSGIDVNGSSYIDLGDARLKWDADNHSLYVTKRPGSSYAGSINLVVDGDVGGGGVGTGASVKYVNCASQNAYDSTTPKDPGTIYTIGTAPSFSRIYLGSILIYGS